VRIFQLITLVMIKFSHLQEAVLMFNLMK